MIPILIEMRGSRKDPLTVRKELENKSRAKKETPLVQADHPKMSAKKKKPRSGAKRKR